MILNSEYEQIKIEYIQSKGLDFWEFVKTNYPEQLQNSMLQHMNDMCCLPTKQYPSQDIELWNQIIGDTPFG